MLADTLTILGYVPEDDAWDTDGRRTYSHEDDATRAYMTTLTGILGRQGWDRDKGHLRMFRHAATGDVIELEPGGPGVTGHFLHHMKAEVVE